MYNLHLHFVGSKKDVGIKADEEQLKILDDVPNSAVEMMVKEKVCAVKFYLTY